MDKDIRGRVTERMLKEALYQLMKRKPLHKITVRELCKEARVSRPTFYTHYHDIYELVTEYEWEKMLELGLADYVGEMSDSTSRCLLGEKVMLALIKHVEENGDIYKNFFENDNRYYLEIALRDILKKVTESPMANQLWPTPLEANCFVSYHCAGIFYALQNWMKMGAEKECAAEEYARIVGRFMIRNDTLTDS